MQLLALDETWPQRRTAARARCTVGIQGEGCQHQRFLNSTASQPSIIYFNYPICDCSTLNTICQETCCYCRYLLSGGDTWWRRASRQVCFLWDCTWQRKTIALTWPTDGILLVTYFGYWSWWRICPPPVWERVLCWVVRVGRRGHGHQRAPSGQSSIWHTH